MATVKAIIFQRRWAAWRYLAQGLALTLALAVSIRSLVLPGVASLETYCPFGAIETAWALISRGEFLAGIGWTNLIALFALGISGIFVGRAFCGWLCPLGTLQDLFAAFARRLTDSKRDMPLALPKWLDRTLRWGKYAIIAWIGWLSISAIVPPLNAYCPLRTLFGLNTSALLPVGIALTFITASMSIERFWCRYACPLGALLGICNRIAPLRPVVQASACRSCGRCARHCPSGIDPCHEGTKHHECIRCYACADACHFGAVTACAKQSK